MHRHLAEAALSTGDLHDTVAEAEQAAALARELNMRGEEGSALRVLGQAALGLSNLTQAEQYLSDSLGILLEVGDEYEAARTELALASLLISQYAIGEVLSYSAAQYERGMEALKHCISTFERLGAQAELVQAESLRTRVMKSEI
jgi:hypothetical protein